MSKMNKKTQRRLALKSFMKKWCMSDYHIYIVSYKIDNILYLIHKQVITKKVIIKVNSYSHFVFAPNENKYIFEIITLDPFLKRLQKSAVEIIVYESNHTYQSFYSLDEIKQYMLIQKIAGV